MTNLDGHNTVKNDLYAKRVVQSFVAVVAVKNETNPNQDLWPGPTIFSATSDMSTGAATVVPSLSEKQKPEEQDYGLTTTFEVATPTPQPLLDGNTFGRFKAAAGIPRYHLPPLGAQSRWVRRATTPQCLYRRLSGMRTPYRWLATHTMADC